MLNKLVSLVLFLIVFLCVHIAYSQEYEHPDSLMNRNDTLGRISEKYFHFYNSDDPLLELEPEEEQKEFKKKKPKRKMFYGYKTKKGFIRSGYGNRQTIEVFFYLKDKRYKFIIFGKIPQEVEPVDYVKEIIWYDKAKRKIVSTLKQEDHYKLLHGPYKKMMNGKIIEKGIYYCGAKHGRWEKYANPKTFKFKDSIELDYQILLSKEKYFKGWPKDAEFTYYDGKKQKVKEIKPYIDGELDGYYLKFYKNGQLAIRGLYVNGMKAGEWIEYYEGTKRVIRKIVIHYARNPIKEYEEPYIVREWAEDGKILYDYYNEVRRSGKAVDKRYYKEEEEEE